MLSFFFLVSGPALPLIKIKHEKKTKTICFLYLNHRNQKKDFHFFDLLVLLLIVQQDAQDAFHLHVSMFLFQIELVAHNILNQFWLFYIFQLLYQLEQNVLNNK